MSLSSIVEAQLQESFGLFRDLAESVGQEALSDRLPNLRPNTVGEQLLCVVGARDD